MSLFTQNSYGGFEPAPSRRTDPQSSHDAGAQHAKSGRLHGCAAIVLEILKRAGKPLTYREIWREATDAERETLREAVMVMRRLDSLRNAGLVRRGKVRVCGVSSEKASEWELVGKDA